MVIFARIIIAKLPRDRFFYHSLATLQNHISELHLLHPGETWPSVRPELDPLGDNLMAYLWA
ncbi:hypothetical protein BHS04_21065 [Myxococcus xanthus]|nr:hypothetical protein BHS04_21065 [Myxococcus xanthus]